MWGSRALPSFAWGGVFSLTVGCALRWCFSFFFFSSERRSFSFRCSIASILLPGFCCSCPFSLGCLCLSPFDSPCLAVYLDPSIHPSIYLVYLVYLCLIYLSRRSLAPSIAGLFRPAPASLPFAIVSQPLVVVRIPHYITHPPTDEREGERERVPIVPKALSVAYSAHTYQGHLTTGRCKIGPTTTSPPRLAAASSFASCQTPPSPLLRMMSAAKRPCLAPPP